MNSATTSLPLNPTARAEAGRTRWIARSVAAVGRVLQEAGRAHARRELLDFASRCEGQQPELAKELRAAAGHNPLA